MKSANYLFAHVAVVQGLRFDEFSPKNFPVSKVVQLLEDMKKQLDKEQDADQEIYEKLGCWCTTNDKEKSKAITDAEAKLVNLGSSIDRLTAQSAQLKVEIEGLKKEVAQNQQSLNTATAIRERQFAQFNVEEKEMLQAIQSLGAAIVVLSKHHKSALVDKHAFSSVAVLLNQHQEILRGAITPRQRKVLASFSQNAESKYQPQSGQIFGILSQMKETFETNLAQTRAEEQSNKQLYVDLKVAKESVIAAGQGSINEKTQLVADTDVSLSQSKQDRDDTNASLTADQKFLVQVKKKCSETDAEWTKRQKLRQEEIVACSEAIEILSKDAARDLFSKTLGFVQVSTRVDSVHRQRASQLLFSLAAKSPKFAALAVAVKLDPFPKVKAAIDKMVSDLAAEKASEIAQRDSCIKDLNTNEREVAAKNHASERLVQQGNTLSMENNTLTTEIGGLENEILDLQTSITRAKEDRTAENLVFQGTLKDQQETEGLLQQALTVLKGVYKTAGVPAFIQTKIKKQPQDFSDYKQQDASKGIVMMIEQIIADTQKLQAIARHDEQVAQDQYTAFKESTTKSIEAKQSQIVNLNAQKAKTEASLVTNGQETDQAKVDLDNLAASATALHGGCDFLMNNFDVRQEARDQEIEALKQAKAVLSGMSSS